MNLSREDATPPDGRSGRELEMVQILQSAGSTELEPPRRFGRYILLDRLGKGGMAEVFRAIMPGVEGFRHDLVIKQIRPDQSHTPNFIEMFVHEARISALLHHPNIVQVFDFGQVDGCYFLAMELLRGRDLLAIMKALRERRRPFPVAIAAHVAQQVALGLAHAHALTAPDGRPLEILHRDVSPSNIMCLATGGVKLLDFGIASALGEADSSECEESTFKGKLSYMAPERLGIGARPEGAPAEVELDGRIDLFSLGTVLWEVLAGRRLFQGKTDADKLRAILEKPIPPPSTLRADIPPRLDEIVLKALERDPDRRYLTAQALAEDLEQVALDAKYQARMLPTLLNELFGSAVSKTHIAISNLPAALLSVEPTLSVGAPLAESPHSPLATRRSSASMASVQSHEAPSAAAAAPLPPPGWALRLRARARRAPRAMAIVGGVTLAGLAIAAAVSRPTRPVAPGTAAAPALRAPAATTFSGAARPAATTQAARTPSSAAAVPGAAANEAVVGGGAAGGAAEGTAKERPASVSHARPVPRSLGGESPATAATRSRPAATHSATSVSSGRVTKGLSIDPFAEAASRRTRRP